ncbi:MAG TPA: protein kinase, partial [Polyangiales bacterium]|nr:protein kinase [Polyangiales bacterium]
FVHAQFGSERPESATRLRREAQAIAHINHPNVVQLYTFGYEQGQAFLVMEYVSGRTLAEELALGALPESRALHLAAQIAAGLSAAHQRGIVHRDLKPENVMLTSQAGDHDAVKLVDFGIAKLVELDQSRLTRTGLVIGTPQYMAPEQIEHNQVDERSDIYCFGLILYEMLAGITTFSGNTPYELLTQHVRAQVVAPSLRAPDVSPALEAIVMRCLQKDPAQRFASADVLRQELVRAAHGTRAGTEARATEALPSSRPLPLPRRDERAETEADDEEHDDAPEPFEVKAPRMPLSARLFGVLGPLMGLAGVWIWFDAMAKMPGNPIARLYARLERAEAEIEGGAPSWVPSALPGALRAASQSDPSEQEKQLAEAAYCLNRNADRGYDSYARYDSWVDLARGPSAKDRTVYGLYTLTGPDDCPEQPLHSADRELAERLASFARAVHVLDRETTKADRYYEQQDYKDDEMRLGQSMHRPLLAAFQAFAESERALRSALTTRRAQRDGVLLASSSPGPERAVHELRLKAQALSELGLVTPEQLRTLSSEHFKQVLEAYGSALDALEASRAAQDLVSYARALQETGKKLLRRLGPKPGWSQSDRAHLDDRLAGWTVDGSPYRVAHDAEALTDALNRSDWLEQRGIVLVEPLIPYLPREK